MIDGVAFIKDSVDPLDWYYHPLAPEFVTSPDPVTGLPVPKFDLIRFRSKDKGNGGLLSFDVECTVPAGRLDDLAGELQRTMHLTDRPRLMPLPLTAGTVKLVLFDLESGQTPAPDAPVHFVTAIRHNASPALYGNDQAMFAVQLDQAGVTALEAAMRGEISPIGVCYALEFLAMRPAYAVTLDIDWDRVQERLDEQFGVDALFFSSQIEDAVDKLVDDRVIRFQADTFVPEGEDEQAVLARRDSAVAEVRDMITQSFFEPSINPAAKSEDGWDKVTGLVNTVSRLAVSGGLSSFAGFTYTKTSYKRVDAKTLNVSMSERTTVKRQIFPQGHLGGLFRPLVEAGVSMDRFVHDIDLDHDPFFERRRLLVVPRVDFAREAVTSVDVRLRYGSSQPRTLVLDAASAAQQVDWPSTVVAGAVLPDVTVDWTVNLASVPGADRPVALSSPPEVVTGDVTEIFTRKLYEVIPVTVTSLDVPWDRFPRVEVNLGYDDAAHGISADDLVVLDAAHPERTWNLFVAQAGPRAFTATVTYRAADFRDVVLPPVTDDDTTVTVRTPYPSSKRRTLEIVPVVDWSRTANVFVDTFYVDAKHRVRVEDSFTFSKDDARPKVFGVDLADVEQRLVSYRVTVVGVDGQVTESPLSQTLDRRILVRPGMLGHRVVTVRPATDDFAAAKVTRLSVELRYVDDDNLISFADTVTLTGDEPGRFEFDYADAARNDLEYRVRTEWANGLTSQTDWTVADSRRDLVVPVGA
jgi:hypothetical protein